MELTRLVGAKSLMVMKSTYIAHFRDGVACAKDACGRCSFRPSYASLMFEYRITKYDPARRNAAGQYLLDEWTSFSDVGSSFSGCVLTPDDYQRIENAYVFSARAFLQHAGVQRLAVCDAEHPPQGIANGDILNVTQVEDVVRRLLREEFWCRLEGSSAFIHVGSDYYMYVGVPVRCINAERITTQLGLFPERLVSPHHPEPEDG